MSNRKITFDFKPIVRPILLGKINTGKINTQELLERGDKVLGKRVLLFGFMTPDQLFRMGFLEAAKKLSKGTIDHSYSEWQDASVDYDEDNEYIPRFKDEEF